MSDPVQAFRAAMLASLGHAPEIIEPGPLLRFPTSDRRGDDAGWCRLFDDLRGGVFGCNRSGLSEKWSAVDCNALTPAERADQAGQVTRAAARREQQRRQEWSKNAEGIARILAGCAPLTRDDLATRYLRRRGIEAWPLPAVLRFHAALAYWDGSKKIGTFPAMVAPLVAPDGRTVALHRTFLTAEGRKAAVPRPKKLTGTAGPLAGACIPLHRPAHGCVGIAEGIETALSAWCASGVPTVAAYCAGNLAVWRWPTGVRRVVIFGDNDPAGRKAADELRGRVLAVGLHCDTMTPTDEGADWCDVWSAGGAVSLDTGAAA